MLSEVDTGANELKQLNVLFTGDFCPLNDMEDAFLSGQGASVLGAGRPFFEQADRVIANLETPLCKGFSPIRKQGPAFRVSPGLAPALKECGFDAFVLANNHICDQGPAGLTQTLNALDQAAIPHTGAALAHEEACAPMVLTLHDRQVAILNFAEGEFARAVGNGPGTARLDPWETPSRVRRAREQYETVVVVLHTGNEYQPIPSPTTVKAFRAVAEAGAHAVIGHHAHIPQSWEVWNGVPICYGLGNFLFGKESHRPCWRLSELAMLSFSDAGATLKVHALRQGSDMALHALDDAQQTAFDDYIKACADILSDPDKHLRFWEQQVRQLFRDQWDGWLYKLSALDTGEPPASLKQRLKKLYAQWKGADTQAAAALFYNLTNCDAHREVLLTAGRLLHADLFTSDDNEVQRELVRLEQLLQTAAALE